MSLQPRRLTDSDRRIIAKARELAAVASNSDANCEYAGETDADHARAVLLGAAKWLLAEVSAIAERLDAPST